MLVRRVDSRFDRSASPSAHITVAKIRPIVPGSSYNHEISAKYDVEDTRECALLLVTGGLQADNHTRSLSGIADAVQDGVLIVAWIA